MGSSAAKVKLGGIGHHVPTSPSPSKGKPWGFAIAIIVGIGGLAVGAVGLAGALSNRAQVGAIIMMAAGGGSGIILLIIGIVGIVKNQQSGSHQRVDPKRSSATHESDSTESTGTTRAIDAQNDSVYRPEEWETLWKVKVLDIVPKRPQVDLSKGDQILLYIPARILVDGRETELTLNVLKEISKGPFEYPSQSVTEVFGNKPAPGGWVLIDRMVLPDSMGKSYALQQIMVEEQDCSMPTVLEAVVLNLMVFARTEERLYGQKPLTYTHCIEKTRDQYPVMVGGFGQKGLSFLDNARDKRSCGVARVRRRFY